MTSSHRSEPATDAAPAVLQQLDTLKALMDNSEVQLADLRPLIVPRFYFDHIDLPHLLLPHASLAVCWVMLGEMQTMLYITHERARSLDQATPNWRNATIQNLRTATPGRVATHEKRDSSGHLLWIAMMHSDGLGSSRLLLHDKLEEEFPTGYWLALPERSMGLAVSKALDASERTRVQDMIHRCYEQGTTPMQDGLFEAELFTLPC